MVFQPPKMEIHDAWAGPTYVPKHVDIYAPIGVTIEVSGKFQLTLSWYLFKNQ